MNNRVHELAEHCDFYIGNEHYDKSHEEQQRLFMEKFAELIVRECIQVAYAAEKKPEGFLTIKSARNLETEIYTHFGVKQ